MKYMVTFNKMYVRRESREGQCPTLSRLHYTTSWPPMWHDSSFCELHWGDILDSHIFWIMQENLSWVIIILPGETKWEMKKIINQKWPLRMQNVNLWMTSLQGKVQTGPRAKSVTKLVAFLLVSRLEICLLRKLIGIIRNYECWWDCRGP